MNIIFIDDIRNITVETSKIDTRIELEDIKGSTTRLVMLTPDTELLSERLLDAIGKAQVTTNE